MLESKNFLIEKAIGNNPIYVLKLLREWFENSAKDLDGITGSYVFYEDIAELLVTCEANYQKITSYELSLSGQKPSCIISMLESTND